MTIKNILLAYNGSRASDNALSLALIMKKKYGARLTGILTHGPSQLENLIGSWAGTELKKTIRAQEAEHRNKIRQDFYDKVGGQSANQVEFIEAGGDVDESLMEVARVYDIVVLGQFEKGDQASTITPHPDAIARFSARPVLVVPAAWNPEKFNESAVLAWDGGRAAARAISDALSILKTKSNVTLVSIERQKDKPEINTQGITAYLNGHGIEPEVRILPRGNKSVSDILLNEMDATGAALLVMGAFEHSKLSEDIWGGVTKSILERAKVPVLMSH